MDKRQTIRNTQKGYLYSVFNSCPNEKVSTKPCNKAEHGNLATIPVYVQSSLAAQTAATGN